MGISECYLYSALGALVVSTVGFVVTLVHLVRAKNAPEAFRNAAAAAEQKLEQFKETVELREKNLALRLEDKEAECARALAEKDVSCRKLVEAAERAKEEAVEAAHRMAREACCRQLEEKEAACVKLLAEKDAELKRKDEDVARQLADRDAQQEKVLREKNAEIERFLSEKEKSFAETVNTLKEQFTNLAAQTLKVQSGDLTKTNSLQLEAVLKPLREQVELLKSATEKTQSEHAKLAESIGNDVGRISNVAKELASVSEALASNISFQGRRGEEILAEKLRQAGLEENVNFFLQKGMESDRPDAQVCDTENRWLIIDSKVVLTSYFQYVEAQDEKTRAAKLAEHVSSVRDKIDKLARKNYPKVFSAEHKDRSYLPVTAMFVAYEAPLMEALRVEPSLWKRAVDNNVILVTPLTLLAYLRLVYLAWQHEKEARNQQEIVDTARELLSRMNNFLMTFEALGKSLADVQGEYMKARSVLVDAPHAQTIAKSANKLIDLHVRLESRRGKRIEKAECLKMIDEEAEIAGCIK